MTDYPYDEQFPYVVKWGDFGAARFSLEENAEHFSKETAGKVIDTTPAPKIPADAEFIHWQTSWKNTAAREGLNPDKPWALDGYLVSEDDLIEEIGDAEVVVLKRA